jgi:hypothetical protein
MSQRSPFLPLPPDPSITSPDPDRDPDPDPNPDPKPDPKPGTDQGVENLELQNKSLDPIQKMDC